MTALSVKVLGCSGSYAGPGGACTGYLLRSATTTVWVDCGPGTFANLQAEVALADLDAVVVSHCHADHCAELPVVYNAARYYLGMDHLRVLATEDVRRVTEAFQTSGDTTDLFEWEIVGDGDTAQIGDIAVRFSATDHPVETLAMRFDCDGSSVAYTSDTGRGWSLTELGPEPDLVIGEGTLLEATDDPSIPHISCSLLAKQANDVGARRLVVTHVPPGSDPADHLAEAAAVFDGPVEVAATGAVYRTPPRPAAS
ncbi:MAG TPA: hypothetical protein DEP69_02065 [Acidimicrobiaceae bacterium]|nr:hypothetical protein [Acidimicrobiaceae bacterium]